MQTRSLPDPIGFETVAELRALYRASEARAARLRLLSDTGSDLALADVVSAPNVIERCIRRVGLFLGRPKVGLRIGGRSGGIPIHAPGASRDTIGWLEIEGIAALDEIADEEDRDAVRLCLELIGAMIHRTEQEAERRDLVAALTEREQRLEILVGQLFSAQEDERRRVSRDLHDGVAQDAAALVRLIEGFAARADVSGVQHIERIVGVARELVSEIRAIIAGLRPTILDDLGFEVALRSLADDLRAEGFEVVCEIDRADRSLPSSVETALFRVAQEAFANIRKHARHGCLVELCFGPATGSAGLMFSVRDMGGSLLSRKADEGSIVTAEQSFGIEIMRERMAAIGGELVWRRGPEGVSITAMTAGAKV